MVISLSFRVLNERSLVSLVISLKCFLQVSSESQSEAALQLLMSRFSQFATQDTCDKAALERLKTLLRLLINNEGRQLGTGVAVKNSSQASVVAAAAARRVDLRRYKTELCRSFAETGQCRYGLKCQFAHGADELRALARHPRYRTELCHSFHVNGFCPYGSRCNFIHSDATAPSAVIEVSTSSKPPQTPSVVHPSAVPVLLQQSPGSLLFLMQSNDVKQRAICGRPDPAEVCPMAVLQAPGSSQAAIHMKLA